MDIKNDASLGANLGACWWSDSSGLTTDLTGNGNTLTNVNSYTLTTGIQGDAADLESSSSQTASRADTASISPTSAASFAFWINHESISTPVYFRKYGGAGDRSYILELLAGNTTPRFSYYDGASFRDASATAAWSPSTATWYHVVVTFNAGAVIYYINGSKLGNTVSPGGTAIADGGATLYLGSDNGAGQFLDGVMNQMCIWSKVLDATDAANLYNGGAGIPYEDSASGPANLKSLDTNDKANIKSYNTNVLANIKSINTNV